MNEQSKSVEDTVEPVVRHPIFTIPQIRNYLTGGLLTRGDDPDGANLPENTALRALIAELEDPEDGIEAVTARTEWTEPNKVI